MDAHGAASDQGLRGPITDSPAGLADAPGALAWAMVDASPDALVVVDEHGVIELVNRQTETLFGYDRDELRGRKVESLMPERVGSIHRAHRTRYRAEPSVRAMGTGMELLARHRDGTEFPVEISLSPLVDGELRIIAAVRDISDRVRAEARDREIRQAFDAVEDGIFMFDPESLLFTYVNDGAVGQVGYSRDELMTMSPLHLKPEFTESSFRELIAPLVAGEVDSVHFETVHRDRSGSDTPVELVVQLPTPPGTSGSGSCVAVVRDISDRLRQESELSDARRRALLLEDRERIGRDMHDTVIARLFGVGMQLQGALSQIDDAEVCERLAGTIGQIDDAIKEIRITVYGLRSRLDWGRGVRGRILALAADQRSVFGFEPNANLDGPIDELHPTIVEELMATIRETLTNIAKHADANKVVVDVSVDDASVRVVVTDDGIGFSNPGDGDGEAAETPTFAGHGLRNLRDRAAALEGTMTVSSRPGVGTVVEWSVPLLPSA